MLIEVKEEDWRNYIKQRNSFDYVPPSLCCPIVHSLKRIFGTIFSQVTYSRIEVGMFPDNIVFQVKTPPSVYNWLKYFDRNPLTNFIPFEFELDLPDTPIT